jgi:conjugal transfer/entry exclusion protein
MINTWLTGITCTVLLAACSKPEPAESVESLLANPDHLKAIRAQCQADHARVGDALCNKASEATRRRFMGSGTPYTPALPSTPLPGRSALSMPKD